MDLDRAGRPGGAAPDPAGGLGARRCPPGRHRDLVIVLLGVLALASLTATGLLIWALATADLTAGQLLLNALVVWSTNLIVFGLLFWELDGVGRCSASCGGPGP